MVFGYNIFNIPRISALSLKVKINRGEKITLLDVRTKEEFARGGLPGAINIPMDKVAALVEKEIPNKKEEIYVYCLSGSRSTLAVLAMQKLGYEKVSDVENGLLAMRVAGMI